MAPPPDKIEEPTDPKAADAKKRKQLDAEIVGVQVQKAKQARALKPTPVSVLKPDPATTETIRGQAAPIPAGVQPARSPFPEPVKIVPPAELTQAEWPGILPTDMLGTHEGVKKASELAHAYPEFRKHLESVIQTPAPDFSWWTNFVANLKKPHEEWSSNIRDSWADPHWYTYVTNPLKYGWVGYRTASSIPASALYAIAGPVSESPSILGGMMKVYHSEPRSNSWLSWDTPVFGAMLALGLAGDVLSDPLTPLTLGSRPLFHAMEKVAAQVPVDLARNVSVGNTVMRHMRRVAPRDINPTTIKETLAPVYLRQHLNEALHGTPATTYTPVLEALEGGTAPIARGPVNPLTAPLSPSRPWAKHLETARADVAKMKGTPFQELLTFPKSVTQPSSVLNTMDDKLSKLARFQAAVETQAWKERPMVRWWGINTGIPSPWTPVHRALSSLGGSWQAAGGRTALREIDPLMSNGRTFSQDFVEYMSEAGIPHVTPDMGIVDAEQEFIKQIVGREAVRRISNSAVNMGTDPVATRMFKESAMGEAYSLISGDAGSIRRWAIRSLQELPPASRTERLEKMIGIIEGFREAKLRDPALVLSKPVSEYDKIVEALTKLHGEMQALHPSRGIRRLLSVYPQGRGSLRDEVATRLYRNLDIFTDMVSAAEHTVTGGGLPGAGLSTATADSVVDALSRMVQAREVTGSVSAVSNLSVKEEGRTLAKILQDIYNDYHTLVDHSTYSPQSLQYRQHVLNAWNTIQRVRPYADRALEEMRSFFKPLDPTVPRKALDEILPIMRSLNTPGGARFWRDLSVQMNVNQTFRPFTAAEEQLARQTIVDYLHALQSNPRRTPMSPNEYAAAVRGLGQIGQNSLGKFIHAMDNLSRTRHTVVAEQGLMSHLTGPLNKTLQAVDEYIRQHYSQEIAAVMAQAQRDQARYTLHEYIRTMGLQGFWAQLDKIQEKALTRFGIPNLLKAIEDRYHEYKTINTRALLYESSTVRPMLLRHMASSGLARPTNTQSAEVMEALGKIIGSGPELRYWHPDPDWRRAVVTTAKRLNREGEEGLIQALGTDLDKARWARAKALPERNPQEVNAKNTALRMAFMSCRPAANLVRNVAKDVWTDLHRMLKEEAEQGALIHWEPNQFPHVDEIAFRDRAILDSAYYQKPIFHNLVPKKGGPGGPVQYAYRKHSFSGMAERLAYIERVNAMRVRSGFAPIEHRMVYNISALMAKRQKDLLSNIAGKNFIASMKAILPHHMRFAIHPEDFPEGVKGLEGWRSLSQLGGSFAKKINAKKLHYVPEALFNYLKSHTLEGRYEESLLNTLAGLSNHFYKLSVQVNLQHLKNIGALMYVARTNPALMWKYLSYSLSHEAQRLLGNVDSAGRVVRPAGQHWAHPLDKYRTALDTHPMFKEATEAGLSHMDLNEGKSIHKIVEESIRPKTFSQKFLPTTPNVPKEFHKIATSTHGPWGTIIFDIVDKASRVAMYEQFRLLGLTGTDAARLSNHYMIDYSMRFLSPGARLWGHMLVPYFGWRIGNMILHAPNIATNPQMYAIESALRDSRNRTIYPELDNVGDMHGWTKGLAQGFAMNRTSEDGYPFFYMPQAPWGPELKVLGVMADAIRRDPSLLGGLQAANVGGLTVLEHMLQINRLKEYISTAADITQSTTAKEKPGQAFWGTKRKPGSLEQWLWAVRPEARALEAALAGRYNDIWPELQGILVPVEQGERMKRKTGPMDPQGTRYPVTKIRQRPGLPFELRERFRESGE